MLVMLAAMAAAQMAPPKPVKPWMTIDDYFDNINGGQEGASLIRVIVSPTGKPEACEIEWSTGNSRMDRLACTLAMRRSSFNAARDDKGQAAWGEFQEVINFYTPDEKASRYPLTKKPDAELTVKHLPSSVEEATVAVAIAIDKKGAVTSCSGEADQDAELASVACEQLSAQWTATPAFDSAGSPIAYVASRKVHFRTE